MPEEFFGLTGGIRAYEKDQREAIKAHVSAVEALGRIAMQPAQQRKIEAEATKNEMALDAEKRMAALMRASTQGAVGGAPTSMADQLDVLARSAAGAGLVVKATGLAKDAALIRQRESSAANSSATRAKAIIDAQRANADLTGQLLGGATDQDSWTRANALFMFQTGKPSPYANLPYSPEIVSSIKDSALTVKEELDLKDKELTRLNLKAFRDRRITQHDLLRGIQERRLELAREREERLAKSGGGRGVSGPVKGELDAAKRLLGRDFTGLGPTDLNDAAYDIAAEARALRRANPALDASIAIQQAYNNARQAGDFADTAGLTIPVIGKIGVKTQYRGAGKSPATAMVIPKNQGDLKTGRYYTNTQGMVGKWTGNGFEVSEAGRRPLSSGNGDQNEDGEDEE